VVYCGSLWKKEVDMERRQRDINGHFLPEPDAVGKPISIRLKKDLEALVIEFAASEGITKGEWCKRQVELAIAAATKPKTTPKKSKDLA
jgi:hypothetical protein